MSVHAQYMVKCAGGGWLCPGRPLVCLGVPTRYPSAVQAFRSAQQAGWAYDVATHEHRCPAHKPGAAHVHSFETYASYPDGPESTARVQKCPCGEQQERPW